MFISSAVITPRAFGLATFVVRDRHGRVRARGLARSMDAAHLRVIHAQDRISLED